MMTASEARRRISSLGLNLAIALAVVGASPAWAASARSSTIAVSPDGARVWVVNRDANSVSVLDALTLSVLGETQVGREPRSLAITPDGSKVYVACLRENRVDVLDGSTFALLRSIAVGREPFGVVVAPNGAKVYVTSTASGTLSVIDPTTDTVTTTIAAGGRPRGLAISPDSSTLALTHYLTPTPAINGVVSLYATATLAAPTNVNLPVLPPQTQLDGVPNIMEQASFRPGSPQIWLPFVASITGNPNLSLLTSVRPEVAIVDTSLVPPQEPPGTRMNLNLIIASPAVSQPVALDFTPSGGVVLVVNQASNDVTILAAPTRTEIRTLAVGSAPDGIAVSLDGARAYVSNFLSRSVSVLAINPPANAVVVSEVSVTGETLPANVLNGKKLFFTSRGRMSTNNNIACTSCHPDAGHDGRVWLFANNVDEGARKTTDVRGIVDSGAVHWTANMDELQDLEWNIRKINFGPGLVDGQPAEALATEPNTGRSQDLDDLAAFMDSLIVPVRGNPNRAPGGGLTASAQRGKQLFMEPQRQCTNCHTGTAGTDSNRTSLIRHDVGTLAPGDVNGQQGFDTMSLRNMHDAAPYLHDGSATLQQIITTRNAGNRHGVTLDLNATQQADLVAFLLAFGNDRDEATVGNGVGLPAAIRVPVRVRDVAFTPLDVTDVRSYDKIYGFSLSLGFPSAGVLGVTVSPAGVAAELPVFSVSDPSADLALGRKDYTVRFGAPIPLKLERAGGDVVAVATFVLDPSATGTTPVTVDPSRAALIGGPGASFEKIESVADENLSLADGTVTVGTPEISSVELGSAPLTVSKSTTPGNLGFSWEAVTGVSYALYGGTLASIHVGTYDHACLASNLAASNADLPSGTGDAYYLVGARSVSFGLGSLGSSASGVQRPNPSPCP
jgi:YVTN family beta-propeller protein